MKRSYERRQRGGVLATSHIAISIVDQPRQTASYPYGVQALLSLMKNTRLDSAISETNLSKREKAGGVKLVSIEWPMHSLRAWPSKSNTKC